MNKYKYSRKKIAEWINNLDIEYKNLIIKKLLETIPVEFKEEIKFCKVCKGTGFDFDGSICQHCDGTGNCETCCEIYGIKQTKTKKVKQDKPVESKEEFLSNCCNAKTKFIGTVYAGYDRCLKCGEKCKTYLKQPKTKKVKHLDKLVVPEKIKGKQSRIGTLKTEVFTEEQLKINEIIDYLNNAKTI